MIIKNLKKIHIILYIIISALFLTGCLKGTQSGTDTDSVMSDSEVSLIIGSDIYEPYNYINDAGEFAGIDVDIAREACSRLGITPVFKQIKWDRKDSLLASGDIDCIWGSFSMNGRLDNYRWAGPYMYSRQVVAVNKDSGIDSLADLNGMRIAVQSTSKPEQILLSGEDSRIEGLSAVYSMSTMSELYASMRKGYADAVAGHESAIKTFINAGEGQFVILDESLYISELGVAFKKGREDDIPDMLDDVLKEMASDGTIGRIAESYGLNTESIQGEE